ncbi:MAG TPA: hemolysin III family protein [Gammaproteobacteria bacterium]|nr:hemolysin III family protein [Gammaproteobacteria bacterium]
MRGYIHQAAFVVALGACSLLVSQSHDTRELVSNVVYSLSLVGLYGVSALYHTPMWSRQTYVMIRRIDHAAIFALMAGSATPICLLGIKGEAGQELIIIIWIIAFLGMMTSVFWSHSPKWVRAVLYITAGWLAVPYLPEIKSSLGMTNLELLLAGGLTYTVGAIIYACKRPDPIPHIFGYHEIFHVLVVVASAFHFGMIYNLSQ